MKIRDIFNKRKELAIHSQVSAPVGNACVMVRNEERYADAMRAVNTLTDMLFANNSYCSVSIRPCDRSQSALLVELVTDSLRISDTLSFFETMSYVTHLDVLPRTDGLIGVFLVFENVYSPLERLA